MSGSDDRLVWQRCGGTRNATTPSNVDTAVGRMEFSRVGSTFMHAAARHARQINLPSGIAASAASLGEGACDGYEVNTDDVVVYRQPVERALIARQVGSFWTGAAGWSMVGNVWTHAPGGGVGVLEITTAGDNAIIVGETCCVIFSMTWRGGTSITAQLGTGLGSVRAGAGPYVELITSATNAKIIFTPTNDADCDIDVTSIYVIPGSGVRKKGMIYPESAIKIVAIATAATPATVLTTGVVWAQWYRQPNATELT